jgi:hypothetical protein
MAIRLTPAERETVMQVDEETMEWNIWTCQRRVMTRLNNAGWEPHDLYEDDGRILSAEYKIPFNAISIRSKKSIERKHQATPEQLDALKRGRQSRINSMS